MRCTNFRVVEDARSTGRIGGFGSMVDEALSMLGDSGTVTGVVVIGLVGFCGGLGGGLDFGC